MTSLTLIIFVAVAAFVLYVTIEIVVSVFVSRFFHKKGWIENYNDSSSFGFLFGIFWPASPIILFFFLIFKGSKRLANHLFGPV